MLLGNLGSVERDVIDLRELTLAVRDLVIASERYRLRMARETLGMGAIEMLALGGLAVDGPSTPSAMAARLQITTASTTELVDRLERAELVTRGPHPTDRRKVLVELTDAGRGKAGLIQGRFDDALGRACSGYDERQRADLLSFLRTTAREVDGIT
jgi:DNA-binding MarR family transcriptional regulator